jgi:hypothetical protein
VLRTIVTVIVITLFAWKLLDIEKKYNSSFCNIQKLEKMIYKLQNSIDDSKSDIRRLEILIYNLEKNR